MPTQVYKAPWVPAQGSAPWPSPDYLVGPNPRLLRAFPTVGTEDNAYVAGGAGRSVGGTSIALWRYGDDGLPVTGFPVIWPPDNDTTYWSHFHPVMIADGVSAFSPVYVVGFGANFGTGDDIYIVKFSHDGQVLATARYDHEKLDDRPVAILVTLDAVYVTATCGTSTEGTNIVTIKYDLSLQGIGGAPLHVESFDGGEQLADAAVDMVYSRHIDGGGGLLQSHDTLVVLGTSYGSQTGDDFVLIAYSIHSGTHAFGYPWQHSGFGPARFYDNGRHDVAVSLGRNGGPSLTQGGTVVFATGASERQRQDQSWVMDIATVALTIDLGSPAWSAPHRYASPGDGPALPRRLYAYDAAASGEEWVMVTGGATRADESGLEITTIALNPASGGQIWVHVPTDDEAEGMPDAIGEDVVVIRGIFTHDGQSGGVYVASRAKNTTTQTLQVHLQRLNMHSPPSSPNGRVEWTATVDSYAMDTPMCLSVVYNLLTVSGGFKKDISRVHVSGRSLGGNFPNPEAYLVTTSRFDQSFIEDP